MVEPDTRKILIAELLNRNRLEKLLRDSFANYVVQTALDYAEPGQRMLVSPLPSYFPFNLTNVDLTLVSVLPPQLVECIRPILPMIRNTPYGKRIQSKLQREHMEQHHYGGGGGYNQQAALLNLALGGNGMNMSGMQRTPIHPHRHLGPSLFLLLTPI